MQIGIDVPFRDAAARDLAWSLLRGPVAPAGLARLRVTDAPAGTIELRVLGASHAVEATLPGDVRVTEVVACGVPSGVPLPAAPPELVRDGVRYRFSSRVELPGPGRVAPMAEALRSRLAGRADALFAAFPGAPGAATALRAVAVEGGLGWETWHLYPERGEVVRTATTVLPVAVGADARTRRTPAVVVGA